MKKWVWFFTVFWLPLAASPDSDACQQELQVIDATIQQLEAQKQQHVNLAKQYQQEGDRWQYDTGRIQDAHDAWGKANAERAQVIQLQTQIDLLYEKKDRIYQAYPALRNS